MTFVKIKEIEYFYLNVISFNNWNRVFNKVMHILRVDFNMPDYDELQRSLHAFLKVVFPSDETNSCVDFSRQNELDLANQMLSSTLSFLIDIDE